MTPDDDKSFGDGATFSGHVKQSRYDMSLSDERTISGGNAAGLDTVLDDLGARYTDERPLGEEGMGAVVLATDTRLGRKVAIKQIRNGSARSKSASARFLIEARAIAAISHPNVIQIYELGVTKTGPYLVIEYIDGGSLLDRCKSGPIPLEEAVEIFVQLCQGLGRAHEVGIVHRDIKPANILLTKDGIAKLTDFGLAKAEAADHGMTMAGAVMGTPDFMPPEQRQDAALVDHRSDLWSLAAAFYQAVSGRSPKVIRLHELPQALQPIMSKALEDEKDARYQSAKEFRDALKSILGRQVDSAKPAVFEGDLQEDQCKACGTVTHDLTKNFCRNPQCGASLRVACLKCAAQMPVWDGVCGECGGNQPALFEAMHAQISGQKASAEALAADLAFDKAIVIAEEIAKEIHPELAVFVSWSKSFIESTNAERDRQQALSAERLKDGQTHFAAFDYAAAIQAIEAIPESLRVGKASKLLIDCRSLEDESVRLVEEITIRIKCKELKGLLPLVSRAVELRGDRKDLLKIRQQLEERRDKKLSLAQTAMEAGDARTAAATLAGAVAEDLGAGGGDLLKRVQRAAALEVRLAEGIKSAKADSVVTPDEARGLLALCDEYLLLNPQGVKLQAIADQCRSKIPSVTNSIGMELIGISAGTFRMGDGAGVAVTLTKPFGLGKYEVTQGEWMQVMTSQKWSGKANVKVGEEFPATYVSWEDATEFCKKLTDLERKAGKLKVNEEYRLPTEAEWEYACRGGTTTAFSFGDDESKLGDYAWFKGNTVDAGEGYAHSVGMKKPNPWGLHDMHGNVWEWCSDWEDSTLQGGTDPVGPNGGSYRVGRGGSWGGIPGGCRSADRDLAGPSNRGSNLGFRVARSQSVQ